MLSSKARKIQEEVEFTAWPLKEGRPVNAYTGRGIHQIRVTVPSKIVFDMAEKFVADTLTVVALAVSD